MATIDIPDKDLKMLRETLCVAQHAVGPIVSGRYHVERIQQLIDAIDVHRPLGSNGKHGNRHTDTCGCEDKPSRAATITAKLVLDTTEFDAALIRVKEALRDLNETPVRVRVL